MYKYNIVKDKIVKSPINTLNKWEDSISIIIPWKDVFNTEMGSNGVQILRYCT